MTFEEPTPPGVTADLSIEVVYVVTTACVPACTLGVRDAQLDAEIPISVAEALGLGR